MTELYLAIAAAALAGAAAFLCLLLLGQVARQTRVIRDLQPKLAAFEQKLDGIAPAIREEGRQNREELRQILQGHQSQLETRLASFGQQQNQQLADIRAELARSTESFADSQARRLGETNQQVRELADRLEKAHAEARREQKEGLEGVAARIDSLTESNAKKQEAIRETLHGSLEQLRKENEAKLEQMRATVDEKLQGTLETRLGESFRLVSERLEQVHRGLGEMQTLASGVGDLKRVLTNVKSRGRWGEIQLGMLLDDMLTVDQYAKNVRIRPESLESVEFAIRLPGARDGDPIWLPIDAKFPHEDYDRLLAAQEAGTPEETERAAAALERAVRQQAKTICEKYIHPPQSTDFAIMYLPTEGLFAEVVRRPGLCSDLQAQHRVMVTGPTTLTAVLSALQMGFRTLAIEKRSSEVWQVLAAAKAEFRKYGEVWEKLGKQLDTAKRTVDEAGRRTRAVERKLRTVEELPLPESGSIIQFPGFEADADEADDAAEPGA
jgi:DNA recombination protein RmuC